MKYAAASMIESQMQKSSDAVTSRPGPMRNASLASSRSSLKRLQAVPTDFVETVTNPSVRDLIRQTIATFDAQESKTTAPPPPGMDLDVEVLSESSPETRRQAGLISASLRAAAMRTDAPPALIDPRVAVRVGGPPPLPAEHAKNLSAAPMPLVRRAPISVEIALSTTLRESGVKSARAALQAPVTTTRLVRPRHRAMAIGAMMAFAIGAFFSARGMSSASTLAESFTVKAPHLVVTHAGIDAIASAASAKAAVTAAATPAADAHDLGSVLRKASAALRNGATRDAGALYLEATEIDPGSAEAWTGLGQIKADAGKLDEAKVDFTRALKANPRFFPAALAMADAEWAAGAHDDAASAYAHLADQYPASLLPARVSERAAH